jgi:hypothetical protein
MKCWGFNGAGAAGQGDTNARGDNPNERGENLTPVDAGPRRAGRSVMDAGTRVTMHKKIVVEAMVSLALALFAGAASSGVHHNCAPVQGGLGDTNNRGGRVRAGVRGAWGSEGTCRGRLGRLGWAPLGGMHETEPSEARA